MRAAEVHRDGGLLTRQMRIGEGCVVSTTKGKICDTDGSTRVAIVALCLMALHGTSSLLADFLHEERGLAGGAGLVDGAIP